MTPRYRSGVALLLVASAASAPDGAPSRSPAGAPSSSLAVVPNAVHLDHVSVVVDSATWSALLQSEFVTEELSAFAVRTTTSGERSWRAIGMSGERTYIEVFVQGAGPGGAESDAIALSAEPAGSLERFAEVVRSIPGATPRIESRTGRLRSGEEIGWFSALHVDWVSDGAGDADAGPPLRRWLMEYHADFIRRIAGDSVAESDRTDLRRRLRVNRYDGTRLMRDVAGVVVETDCADAARLERELIAYGLNVRPAGGSATRVDGLGLTIRAHRAGESGGRIRELRLALARPASDTRSVRLGPASRMRFVDDTTIVWTFTEESP